MTKKGDAHRTEGRYDEALGCYEEALALDARYLRALRGRAWALQHVNLPDALAAAEETLVLYPRDAETHCLKGLVLREMGREEEALAALDEALKLYPRYEQARAARAELLKPEIQRLLAEGQAHYYAESYEEELATYERALVLDERNANAWYLKGQALLSLGRNAQVLAAFERALVLDERDANAWSAKGSVLQTLGRKAEAERATQRARELRGQAGEPLAQVAAAPQQKQQTPAPVAPQRTKEGPAQSAPVPVSRRANKLPAQTPAPPPKKMKESWPVVAAGDAHMAANSNEEALAACEWVLALDEQDFIAWCGKGNALYNLERYAEALEAYEQALALDERYVLAWNGKGRALYMLGREKEAEQALQRWRELLGEAGG